MTDLRDHVRLCQADHMARHPQNNWGTVRYDTRFDHYWLAAGDAKQQLFFCPGCGAALPASQRDRWFDALEAEGLDPIAIRSRSPIRPAPGAASSTRLPSKSHGVRSMAATSTCSRTPKRQISILMGLTTMGRATRGVKPGLRALTLGVRRLSRTKRLNLAMTQRDVRETLGIERDRPGDRLRRNATRHARRHHSTQPDNLATTIALPQR